MQIGMMNDPRCNATDEARWAAEHGLDFLDLTIEGPGADLEQIDQAALRAIIAETGLGIVGHTAWYLPFASPIARVRQAAVASAAETFEVFAALKARHVNVHISSTPVLFSRADCLRWNGESFAHLAEQAALYDLQVMVEHPPSSYFSLQDIETVLNADTRLGFHLDVGHAHVAGFKLEAVLDALGSRLVHVHLSDNRGHHDDHIPLGVGTIDWPQVIATLKQYGYDATITLEVFSKDRDYLLLSVDKVRQWWADAAREQ